MMEDHQIIEAILNVLNGTSYEFVSFERDHMWFGNMISKIKIGKREYCFVSDRGDIFRDDEVVFPSAYHIAGEDDAPKYLIKAIERLVR